MTTFLDCERDAADQVRALLDRPMPQPKRGVVGALDGEFDPWALFPSLYGSYDSEFDELAIGVLSDILDGVRRRDDLAARMFREMLCTANLCDYGTSPRGCFATSAFGPLLPQLIERWKAYAEIAWSDDD